MREILSRTSAGIFLLIAATCSNYSLETAFPIKVSPSKAAFPPAKDFLQEIDFF